MKIPGPSSDKHKSSRRIMLFKFFAGIVCCVALGSVYSAADICIYGKRIASTPAQAAIVLGAAVWGEEPCPVFRERIDHAIVLYRAGSVHKLIFTGGLGKGSCIAESEAARLYAVAQGVAASDILTEGESHTTFENLCYAQQVARQNHLHTFLIVSDPLHMKRAMAMASDIGLEAASSPTPTTLYRTINSQWGLLVHETYFYMDYRLRNNL